jgi:hypothetical protein
MFSSILLEANSLRLGNPLKAPFIKTAKLHAMFTLIKNETSTSSKILEMLNLVATASFSSVKSLRYHVMTGMTLSVFYRS